MKKQRHIWLTLLVLSMLLTACTTTQDSAPSGYSKQPSQIKNAVPVPTKISRYGNPTSYKVLGKTYTVLKSSKGFSQSGIASWYGKKFHGRKTSSGEKYDMYKMTAAHKTLPIPVYVEVTNKDNAKTAVVRVNDRGPFHAGRIIDLSYAAATKLGVAATGTANVFIRVVNDTTPLSADKNTSYPSKPSPVIQTPINVVTSKTISPTGRHLMSGDDKIYVQVAAYNSENNALKQRAKLQKEGFADVRIALLIQAEQTFYQVRIGPLPTKYIAKQVKQDLEQKNYHTVKIIAP